METRHIIVSVADGTARYVVQSATKLSPLARDGWILRELGTLAPRLKRIATALTHKLVTLY